MLFNGRIPETIKYCCSHNGDSATFTFLTTFAAYIGFSFVSSTDTLMTSAAFSAIVSCAVSGKVISWSKIAATSYATPSIDIASARFGVKPNSSTTSSRPNTSIASAPTGTSSDTT